MPLSTSFQLYHGKLKRDMKKILKRMEKQKDTGKVATGGKY
jgi:hypothetical protein